MELLLTLQEGHAAWSVIDNFLWYIPDFAYHQQYALKHIAQW